MEDTQLRSPLNFREREIGDILSKLLAGDCCSVVGVGSVGKSNFLRHFMHSKVQRFHIVERMNLEPDRLDLLTLVLIDPNNMLDTIPIRPDSETPSCWAGYEILMHRLYKAFYPLTGLNDREQGDFLTAYRQLRDGNNSLLPHIGLRYVELGLEILLNPESGARRRRQIVFVFDEFEEMMQQLPTKFFRTLRGLRDDYKYRLMYLTFTRRPLTQIVEEDGYSAEALEPFTELFNDNTYYLGPYSEADAMNMLDSLARRHGKDYSVQFRRFLVRVTGGHAGLLRASFRLVENLPPFSMSEEKAIQFLVERPAVLTECQTIWNGLSQDEQKALREIVANRLDGAPDMAVRQLLEKRLLQDEGYIQIVPPLFREFVRREIVHG